MIHVRYSLQALTNLLCESVYVSAVRSTLRRNHVLICKLVQGIIPFTMLYTVDAGCQLGGVVLPVQSVTPAELVLAYVARCHDVIQLSMLHVPSKLESTCVWKCLVVLVTARVPSRHDERFSVTCIDLSKLAQYLHRPGRLAVMEPLLH